MAEVVRHPSRGRMSVGRARALLEQGGICTTDLDDDEVREIRDRLAVLASVAVGFATDLEGRAREAG